jgi:hypothetical protein
VYCSKKDLGTEKNKALSEEKRGYFGEEMWFLCPVDRFLLIASEKLR